MRGQPGPCALESRSGREPLPALSPSAGVLFVRLPRVLQWPVALPGTGVDVGERFDRLAGRTAGPFGDLAFTPARWRGVAGRRLRREREGLIAKHANCLYRKGRCSGAGSRSGARSARSRHRRFHRTGRHPGRVRCAAAEVRRGRSAPLAGKVGTGFHHRTLLDLRTRFDELSTSEPPFADHVRETRPHWVEPALVAQIAFTEWTRDGMSRHPRSLGPRDDKAARDVVRERPSGLTAR
jgi:hypothetical protein